METGFEKNGLYYEVIDEKKKTVKVRYASWTAKPTGALSIPGTIENEGKKYTVTEIGGLGFYDEPKSVWVEDKRRKDGGYLKNEPERHKWHGFGGCGLTSVTIPETVTIIEDSSFFGCSHLEKVQLPQKLSYIGDYAFWHNSALTSIQLPDTIKKIGFCAFAGCTKLKEVHIPTSLEVIEEEAFAGCILLKKINMPSNINLIKKDAFYASDSHINNGKFLKEVIIDNSDENLVIESGAFPAKTKITYKGKGLLSKLFGK